MPCEALPKNESLSALADDLAALAGEKSSTKRVELLRRIAEAYAAHAEPGMTAEQYLFNEVVSKLIDKIAGPDRAAASSTLAAMPSLPDGLVRRLATDADVDVARPILSDYAAMPERVLIDVAKTGSQDHLRVIAGRTQVTPPVSDVVVERGDITVVGILAGNAGAQFSDRGMRRLIDKAKGDGDLQARLVERKDLSLAAIGRLLPIITDDLAKRLRDKIEGAEVTLVQHLADWITDRQKSVERTEALIVGIRKGDLKVSDIVGELVSHRRLYDAATVLASALGLDADYTFNVLSGPSPQSALLLMRAAGLSWPVADAFLKLRAAKAGLYDYQTPPTRDEYLALDAAAAQRVLRFMKVQQTAGGHAA
ncbi:DUF2336 domain-containing protein [Undibacter mobilis]|nr:DUF2336 domain-containing protein [Undibacter mobilis]